MPGLVEIRPGLVEIRPGLVEIRILNQARPNLNQGRPILNQARPMPAAWPHGGVSVAPPPIQISVEPKILVEPKFAC